MGAKYLRDLLIDQSAERQYKVMEVADRLLPCGRYCSGPLTGEQVSILLEARDGRKA